MGKAKNKYSQDDWDKAFRVYCETGTYNSAAEICSIPFSTLRAQAVREKWKGKREQALQEQAKAPAIYDEHIELVIKDLNLNGNDAETFRNIKNLELICMLAVYDGTPKVNGKRVALFPETFKDAVGSLKRIWDAKESLISRVTGRHESGGMNIKNAQFNVVEVIRQAGRHDRPIDLQLEE